MPYYEINRLQQIYSNSYLQAFDCKLKSTFIYDQSLKFYYFDIFLIFLTFK